MDTARWKLKKSFAGIGMSLNDGEVFKPFVAKDPNRTCKDELENKR